MFWNKTITLYNKYEDDQTGTVKWYRHIVHNCFYKSTDKTENAGGIRLKTNDNVIRIPSQHNYVTSYKWNKLPNNEKVKYITLQSGDLIFLGAIDDDVDEYTKGERSSDLIAKYKLMGSVFIISVNINDFMYGQHYYVRGK